MITQKKISATLKQEVLSAIENINLEFEQNCEGDVMSNDFCKKTIETDHFNIIIELIETVRWSSYECYEFECLEINDFKVIDESGDEYQDEFNDNEILNAINY